MYEVRSGGGWHCGCLILDAALAVRYPDCEVTGRTSRESASCKQNFNSVYTAVALSPILHGIRRCSLKGQWIAKDGLS